MSGKFLYRKKKLKNPSFVKDNLDENKFAILSVRMDYIWV